MGKLTDLLGLDALKRAVSDVGSQIAAASAQAEALKRQREELSAQPANRADLERFLLSEIDRLADGYDAALSKRLVAFLRFGDELPEVLADTTAGHRNDARKHLLDSELLRPTFDKPGAFGADAGMLFSLVGRDAMKTAIRQRMAALTIENEGPPQAERRKRLAELDRQIEDTETKLDALRQAAEDSGLRVDSLARPAPTPPPARGYQQPTITISDRPPAITREDGR